MTEPAGKGRLRNAGGELIAEGLCWVDEKTGEATMEPERTPGTIQRQRGQLQLELESGRTYPVSDKLMIVRLRSWNGDAGRETGRKLYRLRLLNWGANGAPANDAQDAATAGAAGEGTPAPSQTGPRLEETPAARS